MEKIKLETIFDISDNIVAREIEGELIIIPLVSGIGDMDDELFTLNETGKAIWKQINGKTDLEMIVSNLMEDYSANREEIERDVLGLVSELARRRMVVAV